MAGGTEFNYVANIDTSRVLGAAAEIRSQLGMALGGATGFATPAMSLAGGGPGPGVSDFSGGASAGFAQMNAAFARPMPAFGTFTNPAIASMPHFGMQQAMSAPGMENLILGGGLGAAYRNAPPGVGGHEMMMAMGAADLARHQQASFEARNAAGATFGSMGLGMAGGLAADWAVTRMATPVLSAGFTKMFAGNATIGGAVGKVGAFGLGFMAFDAAQNYIGDKVAHHYQEVNREYGEMKEMGSIIGAGRGLSRSTEAGLGIAGTQLAKDLKMDVNQVADIMAGAGQYGLMPTATDPGKFKKQGEELVTAIQDVASALHVSLDRALQVAKEAAEKGKGVREYAISIAGQDGAMSAYAGMHRAVAASPMGDMQLMAYRAGGGTGGMFDVMGSAMGGMGDISDMMKFQVHADEYRKGMGARGARIMARQQLQMGGDLLQELAPGLSENDAQRAFAMNEYGMSGTAAKAYVGGTMGGGGGGGGAYVARMNATRDMALNQRARAAGMVDPNEPGYLDKLTAEFSSSEPGAHWGRTASYAMTGAVAGSVIPWVGTAVGGLIGGIAGVGQDIYNTASAYGGGPSGTWGMSPREKAAAQYQLDAKQYDARMTGMKNAMGYMDLDPAVLGAVPTADYRHTRLDAGSLKGMTGGGFAYGMLGAAITMGGLHPVAAGPGTMEYGGQYYSSSAIQGMARGGPLDKDAPVDKHIREAAMNARYKGGQMSGETEEQIDNLRFYAESASRGPMLQGMGGAFAELGRRFHGISATEAYRAGGALIGKTGDAKLMAGWNEAGLFNPAARAALGFMTGKPLPQMQGAYWAAMGLAGAGAGRMAKTEEDEALFLSKTMATSVGATAGQIHDDYAAYTSPLARRMEFIRSLGSDAQTKWAGQFSGAAGYQTAEGRLGAAYDDWSKAHPAMSEADFAKRYSKEDAGRRLAASREVVRLMGEKKSYEEATSTVSNTEAYAGILFDQDMKRKVQWGVGQEFAARLQTPGADLGGIGNIGRGALAMLESVATGKALSHETTLSDELTKKKRHEGSLRMSTRENAVGFGQQEQAMTTILRSLKSVNASLVGIEKKINPTPDKDGTPPKPKPGNGFNGAGDPGVN